MPKASSRGRAFFLFALLILTTSLHAQRTTGDLQGVVRDASGGVLPGVTVSVSGPNIPRAQTTVTSETGSYRIGNLPPGTYNLSFELTGFNRQHRSVALAPTQDYQLDIALGVAGLDVSVDVGLARASSRGSLDRLESEVREFHDRVRAGYLEMARAEPERWVRVDGEGSTEAVAQRVAAAAEERGLIGKHAVS